MRGSSFIELSGINHHVSQICSIKKLLINFQLIEIHACLRIFENSSNDIARILTLLLGAQVQRLNCVLMANQKFLPILGLFMEEFFISNPLAQEFVY